MEEIFGEDPKPGGGPPPELGVPTLQADQNDVVDETDTRTDGGGDDVPVSFDRPSAAPRPIVDLGVESSRRVTFGEFAVPLETRDLDVSDHRLVIPLGSEFAALDRTLLYQALDRLREEMGRSDDGVVPEATILTTIEGVALVLSSSALAVLMRGASLAAAAFSSLPLWRRVDPLTVLTLSDEERWQREQEIRAATEFERSQADLGRADRRDPTREGDAEQPR